MLRLLFAALLAALCLCPTVARAAQVGVIDGDVFISSSDSEPDNDITVTRTGPGVTITDTVNLSESAAECSGGGTTTVTCTLAAPELVVNLQDSLGAKEVTVVGALASTIVGGYGDDTLTGGSARDDIRGSLGDDTIYGGDSPTTADYMDGGSGNDTLDGQDGNDRFIGGPGGDTIRDTSTQETVDLVEFFSMPGYPDDWRTQGVTVTMDGVRNDGSAQDTMTPGDGGFKDDIEPTITSVAGSEFGDRLTGGPGPNSISGFGGADTITGLGGVDTMHGHAGNDTLNARDGIADATINCNNSDASAAEQPNTATIDGGIEHAVNCSVVDDGGTPAGGTPAGGTPGAGTTPVVPGPVKPFVAAYPKPALKDVVPYPAKSVKMADYTRGTTLCGSRKYCRGAQIKARLEAMQVNLDFEIKEATSKALEKAVGRDVEPGEVLYTDPKAGETFRSGPKTKVEVKAYEFAPATIANNCNLERPYLRIRKKLYRLVDYLKGMSIQQAEETLEDLGCRRSQWEIVDKVSTKVNDVTLTKVRVASKRVELTVTSPPPRMRLVDVKPNLGSGRDHRVPPVFSSGGELSLPDQPFWMAIRPTNEAGVGFQNVDVVLRDKGGKMVAIGVSNQDGIASFGRTTPLATGTYELWAHACDPDGDCIVGIRKIKVIKLRKDREYLGIDGRTWAASGEDFKAKAASAGPTARAAQNIASQKDQLGRIAGQIVTKVASTPQFIEAQRKLPTGEVAKAVQTLNAAATQSIKFGSGFAGYYDALVAGGVEMNYISGTNGVTNPGLGTVKKKVGVVSDGNRVATADFAFIDVGGGILTLKVGNILVQPHGMFWYVNGGGKALGTSQRVKVDATSARLDFVPLQGAMGVGLTGGPKLAGLVGMDGGTLIGMDGSTLVGMDGGTLVGMDGGTLVGMDGGTLVGNDGASLVGMDGGSLIGNDGSTLVAAGGGNLVAAGGGN
jgi:hypothetical protein